ncbi:hypothetical protein [Alkalihalobacillus sp. CinArs1]|uniref:hypothetical protein n=1 Tax=Alkalihalobacillus sp. CinArs1 TaxID=2995314 RepID=UPI0022DE729C|nr:hypothetical protein [Alkalihalobacillus sp. CinArs1]
MLVSRYSMIFYQTRTAIDRLQRESTEKIKIGTLSVITGFSEESILESLEFGNIPANHSAELQSKIASS